MKKVILLFSVASVQLLEAKTEYLMTTQSIRTNLCSDVSTTKNQPIFSGDELVAVLQYASDNYWGKPATCTKAKQEVGCPISAKIDYIEIYSREVKAIEQPWNPICYLGVPYGKGGFGAGDCENLYPDPLD